MIKNGQYQPTAYLSYFIERKIVKNKILKRKLLIIWWWYAYKQKKIIRRSMRDTTTETLPHVCWSLPHVCWCIYERKRETGCLYVCVCAFFKKIPNSSILSDFKSLNLSLDFFFLIIRTTTILQMSLHCYLLRWRLV